MTEMKLSCAVLTLCYPSASS